MRSNAFASKPNRKLIATLCSFLHLVLFRCWLLPSIHTAYRFVTSWKFWMHYTNNERMNEYTTESIRIKQFKCTFPHNKQCSIPSLIHRTLLAFYFSDFHLLRNSYTEYRQMCFLLLLLFVCINIYCIWIFFNLPVNRQSVCIHLCVGGGKNSPAK